MRFTRPRSMLLLLALACICACSLASAQTPAPNQHIAANDQDAPPPPNLYTLHVYTNLMQFAVLTMGADAQPLKHLRREDFRITIDGGPAFLPTKLRIAGDDPLSIAFVIDDSSRATSVGPSFPEALASLSPRLLLPHDHISLYAVDCAVEHTRTALAAKDAQTLRNAANAVLNAPDLHDGKDRPSCGRTIHLWDAVTAAALELAQAPGRRVLVVLSIGGDQGSKTSIYELSHFLSSKAIAFFGFRDDRELPYIARARNAGPVATQPPDPLNTLASANGGLVIDTTGMQLADRFRTFLRELRSRYIVEYPRPDDRLPGMHTFDVSVPRQLGLVRSTGSSSPVRDPALAADPTVLPSAASPAVIGTHPPRSSK